MTRFPRKGTAFLGMGSSCTMPGLPGPQGLQGLQRFCKL